MSGIVGVDVENLPAKEYFIEWAVRARLDVLAQQCMPVRLTLAFHFIMSKFVMMIGNQHDAAQAIVPAPRLS